MSSMVTNININFRVSQKKEGNSSSDSIRIHKVRSFHEDLRNK